MLVKLESFLKFKIGALEDYWSKGKKDTDYLLYARKRAKTKFFKVKAIGQIFNECISSSCELARFEWYTFEVKIYNNIPVPVAHQNAWSLQLFQSANPFDLPNLDWCRAHAHHTCMRGTTFLCGSKYANWVSFYR